jgi:glycosyltransferase involved in cell wall biosynthesis
MRRVGRYTPPSSISQKPPVSVIICARNESENLKLNVPLIMEQDYPKFEVIIVNDCSTDDSDMVLAHLKIKYPELYYTSIPYDKKFKHSKKLAVNIGIKAAKYEHMLFTDADCSPASDQWINKMTDGFSQEGKELVIGYSPYLKQKGFLNRFIRYESFWNAVLYLGRAIKGRAHMGVGRNIAYTKELFNLTGGFSKHIFIESGDDDLFVNEAASRKNTSVILQPEAQTLTQAVHSWNNWISQKARHLSTAPLYKWSHKFLFSVELFSRELVLFITLYALILQRFIAVAAGLFVIRWIVQLCVLSGSAKTLGQKKIFWSVLIFDFALPFILGYIYITNLFRTKQVKWK